MLLLRELQQIHRRLGRAVDVTLDGPQDEADAIVALEIRELDARERGRLEARARRLREAIRRVDEGTYGRCVECAEAIPRARLQALPEAERCVRCQEAADGERDGDGHFRRIPRPLVERLDEDGG